MSDVMEIDEAVELPGFGLRQFLSGALVVAVAASTLVLTQRPDLEAYEGGGDLIATLYATGGEALAGAWDPRAFVALNVSPQETPAILDTQFLNVPGQPPATVVGEQVVNVNNVPLVRVDMSDQSIWCVRPDGVVLPFCIIGSYNLVVDDEVLSSSSQGFSDTSLSLLNPTLAATFVIEPTTDDLVELIGVPRLTGNPLTWQLTSVDLIENRQIAEVTGEVVFGATRGLGVQMAGALTTGPDVPGGEDITILPRADFAISWDNISVPVSIIASYWLDAAPTN